MLGTSGRHCSGVILPLRRHRHLCQVCTARRSVGQLLSALSHLFSSVQARLRGSLEGRVSCLAHESPALLPRSKD